MRSWVVTDGLPHHETWGGASVLCANALQKMTLIRSTPYMCVEALAFKFNYLYSLAICWQKPSLTLMFQLSASSCHLLASIYINCYQPSWALSNVINSICFASNSFVVKLATDIASSIREQGRQVFVLSSGCDLHCARKCKLLAPNKM